MPHRYQKQILRHISHAAYEPRRVQQLAEDLGVDPSEHETFREAIEQLAEAGHVVLGAKETVTLPPIGDEVTGRFKLHARGFGFVIPDQPNTHGDLFVPAPNSGGALTGDRVRAKVIHKPQRRRRSRDSPYIGRVVEVLHRSNTRFVGTLEKRGKQFLVMVDGKALSDPVVVRDPGAKHASVGTKVVVELTRFPDDQELPEGVITEVLGEPGDPGVETKGVCRAYDLRVSFPEEMLEEARQLVRAYNDDCRRPAEERPKYLQDRVDLRETFLVTIDPPDAQDFDDGISIRETEEGTELGVHISDVSSFVQPGSHLDAEAYARGNSAYLPCFVLPMLPEVLSNGICSLQPGVDRLAKSVFITYDASGRVLRRHFANTLVRSDHRLTYLESQALIDGDWTEARRHAKADSTYDDTLVTALRQMRDLADRIRSRRQEKGMITLDLPEVELIFDERGHVIDAEPEDDAYTHKIIEAFMVEANEAVAGLFADLDVGLIRRIHPEPTSFDVSELRRFARLVGYKLPSRPTRKNLQELLDEVRDKPAAKAVHFAVLKTLTKAEYGPQLIGHFALASEHYAHFTSPIRRYPDLTVHRALQALFDHMGEAPRLPEDPEAEKKLGKDLRSDARCPDEGVLAEVGHHCSTTERNAEAAERELRDLLVLQLLEREHLGDTFRGTLTGVTSFGVFIQIDKYLVEGLIRTRELPGGPAERWKMDGSEGSLVAVRSGRRLSIGDSVKVQVTKVDLTTREMDLLIVEPPRGWRSADGGRRKKRKSKNKPKSGRKKRRTTAKRKERP